jgi:hypothetical protein
MASFLLVTVAPGFAQRSVEHDSRRPSIIQDYLYLEAREGGTRNLSVGHSILLVWTRQSYSPARDRGQERDLLCM